MSGGTPTNPRPSVALTAIATASPMGQQAYERLIYEALRAGHADAFDVRTLSVASLRGPGTPDRRLPRGWLAGRNAPTAGILGAWAYRGQDLVHRLDLRLPPRRGGRDVVTIHDLPVLRFQDEGDVPKFFAAGARAADAIIVPSEFARREVVELLNVADDNVHVIPYGLSETYRSAPAAAEDARLPALPKPFLLHAAGATTRKNLGELALAWAELAARHPDLNLVLCGPEDARRTELFDALPRTHLMGRVVPGDVAWLMRRAEAVIVPSIYEGFGLPAMEAMAAGTPVVAARAGALPEVCAEAAILVEPSAKPIADAVTAVLEDAGLAERLRTAGPERAATFSWPRAAAAHAAVYRDVLGVDR